MCDLEKAGDRFTFKALNENVTYVSFLLTCGFSLSEVKHGHYLSSVEVNLRLSYTLLHVILTGRIDAISHDSQPNGVQ